MHRECQNHNGSHYRCMGRLSIVALESDFVRPFPLHALKYGACVLIQDLIHLLVELLE